ncbi:hypothetical protein J6590_099894 [Homalodisca vitripennis]|nr:hypothetical protein J6590_099894 [Homalodisca vitripennis]
MKVNTPLQGVRGATRSSDESFSCSAGSTRPGRVSGCNTFVRRSLLLFCRFNTSCRVSGAQHDRPTRPSVVYRLSTSSQGVWGATGSSEKAFSCSVGSTLLCRVSGAQHARPTKPSVVLQAQNVLAGCLGCNTPVRRTLRLFRRLKT